MKKAQIPVYIILALVTWFIAVAYYVVFDISPVFAAESIDQISNYNMTSSITITGDSAGSTASNSNYLMQSFTAGKSEYLTRIIVKMAKYGSGTATTNLTAKIYTFNTSTPYKNTLIATSKNTIAFAELPLYIDNNSAVKKTFEFDYIQLTSGTKYIVEITKDTGNNGDTIKTIATTNGTIYNSGESYFQLYQATTYDIYFETYTDPSLPAPPPEPTPTTEITKVQTISAVLALILSGVLIYQFRWRGVKR